jgi:hypothetical protein
MSARIIPGTHPLKNQIGSCGNAHTSPLTGVIDTPSSGVEDRLLAVVDAELTRTRKWATWCQDDPRLAGLAGLADVVEGWQSRRDIRSYQVVAALTAIGSRRGCDDDDAAMAVVVLLAPGITRLAATLRDVCEVDDVRATVWEQVKLAEPQLGNLAARYLLQRARQRLTRPAAGMVGRIEKVSLDQRLGWAVEDRDSCRGDSSADLAAPEADDPVSDLADLLTWARGVGVIEPGDVDLIVELMAAANAGIGTEDAQRLIGARHGVAMRTIRRRRDAILARLRAAAPQYLAATA